MHLKESEEDSEKDAEIVAVHTEYAVFINIDSQLLSCSFALSPPRCSHDWESQKHIEGLAEFVQSILAQRSSLVMMSSRIIVHFF